MFKSTCLSSFTYPKEKWLIKDEQSFDQQNNYKK
jgi:hypothetical protein